MKVEGKAVAAAWVKARAAIGATVTKDARGNFGRYATLAAVMETITPALSANGLALVQEPELLADGLVVNASVIHESGECITFGPITVQPKDRLPQSVGSALTYARRYQLAALFGLAPDDDDGQAATQGAARDTRQQPATATQRKQPDVRVDEATPLNPDPPTEREAVTLGKWTSRQDAQDWAVKLGTCANNYEAINSYEKILREHFDGHETDANRAAVWLAFMRRQGEKWRAMQGEKVAA